MTFSSASLDAGLVGLLCSVPLVVCSLVGHARETKDMFPVLDELYASQREVLTPWLSGEHVVACLAGWVEAGCMDARGWHMVCACEAVVLVESQALCVSVGRGQCSMDPGQGCFC